LEQWEKMAVEKVHQLGIFVNQEGIKDGHHGKLS
jgi:hypothetical protein